MTLLSPHFSREQGIWLFSPEEGAVVFGVAVKTVRRWLKAQGSRVYSEEVTAKRADGKGGQITRYIDLATLGQPLSADVQRSRLHGTAALDITSCGGQAAESLSETNKTPVAQALTVDLHKADLLSTAALLPGTRADYELALPTSTTPVAVGDLDAASELHVALLPVLKHKAGTRQRSAALEEVAQKKGVHSRTVRRWVAAYESSGLLGLSRLVGAKPRSDKGTHRLPLALIQIVQSVWISNPRTISARKVHQIVVNAVPELAHVTRTNGRVIQISVATVQAIRDELLADPTLRLLLADADTLKEYRRTWSGQVLSAHANDIWQMDMTRCDVMIYDPENDTIYRPRVQAVIDVYSGAIMSLAFSRREDQHQADLVLARALMRKHGPLAAAWPMYGIARRLYIDNGKTYKSAHFHRIVSGVGMEIIHSRPRVSHTRGRIERFFGTLHGLERALRGYCGANAVSRSNEELKRLYRNTLAWAREGKRVPDRDRLMTLSEYQELVLKWLVTDYHATVEHGLSRTQHFISTAPKSTLVDLDLNELLLLFAQWQERTVSGNGVVMIGKIAYTTPSGKLAQYQHQRVQVLTEPFALGDPRRLVAWTDRQGRTQIIGELTPAPTAADSLEAAAQRRANRMATKEQMDLVDTARAHILNPAVTYEAHLQRQMEEVVVQPLLPAPRGRLAAVNPPDAMSNPIAPDALEFAGAWSGEEVPDDMDDIQRWLGDLND